MPNLGKLAKTDTLDARVLARFGEATKPQPRPLPDAQAQELQWLLARRRQLERLNQDLGTLICSSLVRRAKEQLLRSVP